MGRKRHTARNIALVLLLAVVCIGGTELAVCRMADPALFSQLVSPAVNTYRGIERAAKAMHAKAKAWEDAGASAWVRTRAGALWERELTRMLSQEATDPAILTEYQPADPTITELVTENGREYLLGGSRKLRYFNQTDAQWQDAPFGVDPIGGYGCGPTALAMAVSSLTEEDIDPAEMAAWAAGNGYAAPHSGSYLSIVAGTAKHYGLRCEALETQDAETLRAVLSSGGLVVALMGPGHFTKGGHFILLHGVTLGGDVLVADPKSRENSLMVWDAGLITEELSASRWDGAPLWVLTRAAEL